MPTDDVYPCLHCHGTGEVRPRKGEDMSDINALLDRIREQAARHKRWPADVDPPADSEGGEQ